MQSVKNKQYLFSSVLSDHPKRNTDTNRLEFQPSIIKGGQLKGFQIDGVNWLMDLYVNGRNGILADEMGLGKSVQVISFLAFLKESKYTNGPHLIISPTSVLSNWAREFEYLVSKFVH